ncbi:serine hydrolase domain-containing protein [Amycolatopsis thermophila]|uniref:CubicO group peptidase (Beta-lactamase class C family) n=1 Tax=Amycolatopsis thermophila TaxID=206084 RepID=A0ABU0EPW3_9PSEU|nr:serine hydrolase domain-containing protein [Amycolatopsis thermophila]MDQ0377338.1 CubicO group peptidase (beta-lactamase class C family) [Amycolatopsis thermophila]
MSTGGLSKARLGRLHDVMAGYVERGEVPGVVTLVERRGEVHVDVLGSVAFGGPPLRRDNLFRISSMTKPVAAAAAMVLVEQCRLRLDEPVDELLPELADRRVLTRADGPLDDTVPAERALTLRDLLTFRMGFGQLYLPEEPPIVRAANEAGLGMGPPRPSEMPEPDEWMRRLGAFPLMYPPGMRWLYNTGSDVLGVLLARVTGKPLEDVLREAVLDPLGMDDTRFCGDPGRLVTAYLGDGSVYDPPEGEWSRPPAFPSAAAGLVSTVDDYLAFGRMMLHFGRFGSERLLARPTVEAMVTDQLTPGEKAVSGFYPGYFDTRGWGFGLSMTTARDGVASVPGRFGWDGGLGTSWFSDPKEDLIGILLTQKAGFPQFSNLYLDYWTSVYQAIAD